MASLAIGIGANAAIVSMFDRIPLHWLPVSQPERLVNLTANGLRPGNNSTGVARGLQVHFQLRKFRDLEK